MVEVSPRERQAYRQVCWRLEAERSWPQLRETIVAWVERSADVAERSEARQTERNGRPWECALVEGMWTITNTGIDDALQVVAIVTVDDDRLVKELDSVGVIEPHQIPVSGSRRPISALDGGRYPRRLIWA